MRNKSKKIFAILFSLIASTNLIFAQDAKFDSLVTNGINHIYNIKFDKAEEIPLMN